MNDKHNPADHPKHSGDYPGRISKQQMEKLLPSAQEPVILQRVEHQLMDTLFPQEQVQMSFFRAFFSFRGLSLAMSTACCVGLCIFFLYQRQHTPPFQYSGNLSLKSLSSKGKKLFQVQTSIEETATLQEDKTWQVKLAGGTRLTFHPKTKHRRRIKLHKGFISVQVQPKTVKLFSITGRDYQLVVKGTQFTVFHAKQHMQLEVWSGAVSFQPEKGKHRSIKGGHGLYFSKSSGVRTYPLPPKSKRTPTARLQWLKTHHPKHVHHYAQTIVTHQHIPIATRRKLLTQVADWQRSAKQHRRLLKTLVALFILNPSDDESSQALFEAARLCNKKNFAIAKCNRLFKVYIKNYPKRQYAPTARKRLQMGLALANKLPSEKAFKILQDYIKQYPTGARHIQVRQHVIKTILKKKLGCQMAHSYLVQGMISKSYKKHCE